MQRFLFLFFIVFFLNFSANAQCANARLFENFDANTVSNPPSGWQIHNVDFGNNNASFPANSGINRLGMNDLLDTIISKPIYCPGNFSFYWRASGASSNFTVRLQYTTDNINWITFDSIHTTGANSPLTYQLKNAIVPTSSLLPPFQVSIRWNMTRRVGGTFYLDDVCILPGTCFVTPTQLQFKDAQTSCIQSNTPFVCKVCATNATGFIDSSFAGSINLSKASGVGNLGGNLSIAASNGCALFSNVTFSGASPLVIKANSGALNSVVNLSTLDIKNICPNEDTLTIVTYNVLNFPLGGVYALGGSCSPQQLGPNRWDTLRGILQYIKPDVLIVQELQTEAGADSILLKSLNGNGITNYARATYIPNKSTINTKYNNMLFYNTNKLGLIKTSTIGTSIRDCGVYKLYCKDPQLNSHNDTTFLDMYSIHTKAKGLTAAQATADSIQRASDCKLVMDTIRLLQSANRNAIIGGDLNLYSSAEGAFINFTSGLYKFNDPLNQPGAWESNYAFRKLHTQAVRASVDLSLECGARGGLDSRLDFLLATDPIINNSKRMEYITNTYTAFGNSGTLFNKAVNNDTFNTSGVPQNILNKLFNMSDHLPVVMKLRVQYPVVTPLGLSNLQLEGSLVNQNVNLNWNKISNADVQKLQLLKTYLPTGEKIFYTVDHNFIENKFSDKIIRSGKYSYQLIITLANNIAYSNELFFEDSELQKLIVFPNPANTEVAIQNYIPFAKYGLYSQSIISLDGRVQWYENLNTQLPQITKVDISSFKKGIYFVILQKENQVIEKKKLIIY